MKQRDRLRRPRDFQRVLAQRRVYSGRCLVGFVEATASSESRIRIGVTSSRRIRGAVQRNRARRRLREIARLVLLRDDSPLRQPGIRFDVVLIARPEAVGADFESLRAEAERLLALVPSR